MKNTFKTHTAIEKAVTKCTKEVTRKPVTLSFLLGGDNRKYNPHSRVPFFKLRCFVKLHPWRSFVINNTDRNLNFMEVITYKPVKKNSYQREKGCIYQQESLPFFYRENSTDVTKLSNEELERGNGEQVHSDNVNQNLVIFLGSIATAILYEKKK